MSIIETKNLLPGMITAAPVLTKTGQHIMDANICLDKKLIARLDFYSIPSVEIVDEPVSPSEEPIPEEPAPAKEAPIDRSVFAAAGRASNLQKIQRSDRFRDFQVSYTKSVFELSAALDGMVNSTFPTSKELLSTCMQVLNEHRMTTIELFDMLHNMRQNDDSVYAHSLNVAFIARILGKWMKLSAEEIEDLTLAGLIHDVGKLLVPKEILNKPEKLTDEEFQIVRMHPQYGFDLVKNQNYPKRVVTAILNHHERCDGSGYPNHLSGNAVDDFSLIIAAADVYDAMTAARSYRAPLSPFA
ncbi:MAG: HD domain-containing protein, partial [Lachnospiraceae bacterium]|nr:HD domain-containing protein [Lachnospiraceae bacterium]